MSGTGRSIAAWIIATFLALSIVVMGMGQSVAVFNYDLTVRLGLQESLGDVGNYGIEVNRAFAAADTLVYIPLMILSLAGLLLRKRWSLITTAAVAGISVYWSVTIGCMLAFLPGTPSYTLEPGPELWIFLAAYTVFGAWSLLVLVVRGELLLR